ncbi:MAG: alpha/beta hydrolase [Gammaproteobacteria bacterium]|nr:MAG: alpha/beta hydrolase [Gammaproteobacteria bacterium]
MNERVFEEISIEANGLRFAAKMWGPKDGKPLLALHGWLDNACSFDEIAPLLGEYRLCALDMAGHGFSQHRALGSHYYFTDYISDAIAVSQALGWDQFNLLGHSLGANVAIMLAGTFPEKIQKLLLIEGFGPQSRDSEQGPNQLRQAIEKSLRFSARRTVSYPTFDEIVAKRMNGGTIVNEHAARILCQRATVQTEKGWQWRSDPRLRYASPLRFPESEVEHFIRQIDAPTCLIVAEQGFPLVAMGFEQRRCQHPNLHVVTLAGRHHLHVEGQGGEVADVIKNFIS